MTNSNDSTRPQDGNNPLDDWDMDDWQSAGWPGVIPEPSGASPSQTENFPSLDFRSEPAGDGTSFPYSPSPQGTFLPPEQPA